jgi:hypothetical protein
MGAGAGVDVGDGIGLGVASRGGERRAFAETRGVESGELLADADGGADGGVRAGSVGGGLVATTTFTPTSPFTGALSIELLSAGKPKVFGSPAGVDAFTNKRPVVWGVSGRCTQMGGVPAVASTLTHPIEHFQETHTHAHIYIHFTPLPLGNIPTADLCAYACDSTRTSVDTPVAVPEFSSTPIQNPTIR